MKSKLMPSIVLGSICIIVALLMAAVNMITAPIIAASQAAKVQETLGTVLPEGKNFVSISTDGLPETVTSAYTEDGGGYVFQMEVIGYKSGLIIMCGVSADGKITGAEVIDSNETMSAEHGLGEKYIGKDITNAKVEIVSSSTLTSQAYFDAIAAALQSYKIITEKEDAQ